MAGDPRGVIGLLGPEGAEVDERPPTEQDVRLVMALWAADLGGESSSSWSVGSNQSSRNSIEPSTVMFWVIASVRMTHRDVTVKSAGVGISRVLRQHRHSTTTNRSADEGWQPWHRSSVSTMSGSPSRTSTR